MLIYKRMLLSFGLLTLINLVIGINTQENTTECNCGWTNRDSRILGGEFSQRNEWPMMAGILTKNGKFQFCGGTVISRHHVITAAHCVHDNGNKISVNLFGVIFGIYNLDEVKSRDINFPIKVIPHPKYRWPLAYDLAILLMKDIPLSNSVVPACLPSEKFNSVGKTLDHTGWGKINANGPSSRILKKTKLEGVNLDVCNNFYGKFGNVLNMKEKYQMCTYKKATSQCKGDSGGPILYLDPNSLKYILIGVISFGWYTCDSPSVNTDVSYFVPWINQILEQTGDHVCAENYYV